MPLRSRWVRTFQATRRSTASGLARGIRWAPLSNRGSTAAGSGFPVVGSSARAAARSGWSGAGTAADPSTSGSTAIGASRCGGSARWPASRSSWPWSSSSGCSPAGRSKILGATPGIRSSRSCRGERGLRGGLSACTVTSCPRPGDPAPRSSVGAAMPRTRVGKRRRTGHMPMACGSINVAQGNRLPAPSRTVYHPRVQPVGFGPAGESNGGPGPMAPFR